MKRRVLPIAVLSLVLAGCAFVKPESGSEQVQILTQQQATACKKLGYANVYTKHEVLGLKRNDESVRDKTSMVCTNKQKANRFILFFSFVTGVKQQTLPLGSKIILHCPLSCFFKFFRAR
mgnify:CR=1 FL=1